jgi:hypothetical protein
MCMCLVSWLSLSEEEQSNYIGVGSIQEPRFVPRKHVTNPEVYPELPLPILAYNRHMDDRNVLLIPDSEFLLNGFDKYIRAVISSDIEYASKLSVMYWRGGRHINEGYRYVIDSKFNGFFLRYGLDRIHPRELANALTRNEGLSPPALQHIFNTSYEYVPLSDALRYRYLLDIDGQVSAWSGFYW